MNILDQPNKSLESPKKKNFCSLEGKEVFVSVFKEAKVYNRFSQDSCQECLQDAKN